MVISYHLISECCNKGIHVKSLNFRKKCCLYSEVLVHLKNIESPDIPESYMHFVHPNGRYIHVHFVHPNGRYIHVHVSRHIHQMLPR